MDHSSASRDVSEAKDSPSKRARVSGSVDGATENEPIRDERAFKRQQRKIANRVAAEKSRLKKRTELAELRHKVEMLSNENQNLKNELLRVSTEADIIKAELSKLVDGHTGAAPQG